MAVEPGFSHDFNGLVEEPWNSLCFPAASDRGCHLCALALGISELDDRSGIISAFKPEVCGEDLLSARQLCAAISAVETSFATPEKQTLATTTLEVAVAPAFPSPSWQQANPRNGLTSLGYVAQCDPAAVAIKLEPSP